MKMNKKKERTSKRTVRIIYPNATTTYIPPPLSAVQNVMGSENTHSSMHRSCVCLCLCIVCMRIQQSYGEKIPMCNITKCISMTYNSHTHAHRDQCFLHIVDRYVHVLIIIIIIVPMPMPSPVMLSTTHSKWQRPETEEDIAKQTNKCLTVWAMNNRQNMGTLWCYTLLFFFHIFSIFSLSASSIFSFEIYSLCLFFYFLLFFLFLYCAQSFFLLLLLMLLMVMLDCYCCCCCLLVCLVYMYSEYVFSRHSTYYYGGYIFGPKPLASSTLEFSSTLNRRQQPAGRPAVSCARRSMLYSVHTRPLYGCVCGVLTYLKWMCTFGNFYRFLFLFHSPFVAGASFFFRSHFFLCCFGLDWFGFKFIFNFLATIWYLGQSSVVAMCTASSTHTACDLAEARERDVHDVFVIFNEQKRTKWRNVLPSCYPMQ